VTSGSNVFHCCAPLQPLFSTLITQYAGEVLLDLCSIVAQQQQEAEDRQQERRASWKKRTRTAAIGGFFEGTFAKKPPSDQGPV